jgi:hypothetical protein
MQLVHSFLYLQGRLSFPGSRKFLCHLKTGPLRFSNDHWESGAFANAGQSGIRVNPDENILREQHGSRSYDERFNGYAELIDLRLCDKHNTKNKELDTAMRKASSKIKKITAK